MTKKTTDILSNTTASMNPLQRQWYHLLLARKIAYQGVGVMDNNNNNNNNNNNQSNGSIGKNSYSIICQERYREAFRRYNQRFRQEIKQLEAMQPSAIDAMRLHRTFSITTLWPPLHSKREINLTLQRLEMILSVTERRRLQEILKYGPVSSYLSYSLVIFVVLIVVVAFYPMTCNLKPSAVQSSTLKGQQMKV